MFESSFIVQSHYRNETPTYLGSISRSSYQIYNNGFPCLKKQCKLVPQSVVRLPDRRKIPKSELLNSRTRRGQSSKMQRLDSWLLKGRAQDIGEQPVLPAATVVLPASTAPSNINASTSSVKFTVSRVCSNPAKHRESRRYPHIILLLLLHCSYQLHVFLPTLSQNLHSLDSPSINFVRSMNQMHQGQRPADSWDTERDT